MKPQVPALWLQGLLCGALLAFAAPVALLAAVLLAPAWIAAMLDGGPGRRLLHPVLLAGLALSVQPLWQLWQSGSGFGGALDSLAQPRVVLPAWLAGACGWAISELLPGLLRVVFRRRAAASNAALRAELKRLTEIWELDD